MRIAYIAPTGVWGGVRAVVEHLNRLGDRGHDCTLIATDPQPVTWLPTRFEQRPFGDAGAGYDVVVGTALGTWAAAVDLARRNNGRSAGLMQMAEWLFATPNSEAYYSQLKAFVTPVDSVMAISDWLAKFNKQVPGRVVHRIRNGIDTKLFFPQPFPDAPPFDGVTVLVEGYGTNRAKDVDSMAFSAIRRARWDAGIPLRVWGLSQFPAQFEFDNHWRLPAQHIIRMIYSTADIFLKASRFEGRPGPDLEAMACGAVVCRAITPGCGDDDLREDNCLRTEYGNLDEFTANLIRLCESPETRAMLRDIGLAYVKEHCRWDDVIDLVEMALTGAVTKPKTNLAVYQYDLATYNSMQDEIVGWEGAQATWLGETLADMLQPKSVIDIGCGPGIYLVPFKPQARVLGVDGAPAAGRMLEKGEFVRADLRKDGRPREGFWYWWDVEGLTLPDADAHFDLSLCIETGEHLPPDRADYLVELLTSCSEICFFSAAQPGQGGTLHLNEQPKSYWLEKFAARGWGLHPRNDELQAKIAANPACQRVQWLVGNAMLLRREP